MKCQGGLLKIMSEENYKTKSPLYNTLFNAKNNPYTLIEDEVGSLIADVTLPSDFTPNPHVKWTRTIDEDGKKASLMVTYEGPELKDHCPIVNESPMKFSETILKGLAKQMNVGDGTHRGDTLLQIEDSNIQNPADSSSDTSQFQIAFRITLQDIKPEPKSDSDKESDKDDGNSDSK